MNVASSDDLSEENLEAARTLDMNFLHEMGWLLRRSQLRCSSESQNSCLETFSLLRFRWIVRFAIDHDWSASVKKFLDILFEGNIETDGRSPNEVASSEYLLHYAVQRNSNLTVKLLLKYKPNKASDGSLNYLFRPDMPGPSGITPLHVAATSSFAESMLNILTDDPGQVCFSNIYHHCSLILFLFNHAIIWSHPTWKLSWKILNPLCCLQSQ